MTESAAYKEHIEHTFNAYCMIVIRHAAIDAGRALRRKWQNEISLEYLTEDKHFPLGTTDEYFAEPEPDGEYPYFVCGDTILLNSAPLATALPHLKQIKQEMLYLRFYQQLTYEEIGRRYGCYRSSASHHVSRALRQLKKEMEAITVGQNITSL